MVEKTSCLDGNGIFNNDNFQTGTGLLSAREQDNYRMADFPKVPYRVFFQAKSDLSQGTENTLLNN